MHLFIHTYMYIHISYTHNRYIFVDDLFIEKKPLILLSLVILQRYLVLETGSCSK